MNFLPCRLSFAFGVALTVTFALSSLRAHASDAHGTPSAAGSGTGQRAPAGIGPSQALQRLLEGNLRFVDGHSIASASLYEKREATARGQKPFAIVVTCSDSRVPPEIVFDQGIGDIFVVRSAGHVVDDVALGSIEYAVQHLGSALIFVLGHERCGAVAATCEEGEAPGHLDAIVKAIKPAASSVERQPGDMVDNAVRANVRWVVTQLSTSEPVLAKLLKERKLRIQGGRYDLDTGKVDLVD